MIYGASLGGWTFLVLDGVMRFVFSNKCDMAAIAGQSSNKWDMAMVAIAGVVAAVVGVGVWFGFRKHDRDIEPLQRLPQRHQ